MAQAQAVQEVVVADEDQGEGGFGGQVEAQQEADLLQGGVAVELGLVEDDHQLALIELAQGGLDALEIALAAKALGLPELVGQGGQETTAAQAGLGQADGQEDPGIELPEPLAGEGGLADAIGAGEQEHTLEGGRLLEMTPHALEGGCVEPVQGAEGDGIGPPGAGPLEEFSVFHSRGGAGR